MKPSMDRTDQKNNPNQEKTTDKNRTRTREPQPTQSSHHPRRRRDRESPALRLTPYAYAKLHFLCHLGQTEIGGFAISKENDLLLVEDLVLIKQTASTVSVEFEDEAVADFFDLQVDQGRRPEQFGRIWLHTHPGDCAIPSGTDEATFDRVFGHCDWAVMFILAREGQTYARLRFNAGPGGQLLIPVEVDYGQPFEGSDQELWKAEYDREVTPIRLGFDLLVDENNEKGKNGRHRRHRSRDELAGDVFADVLEQTCHFQDEPDLRDLEWMGIDPWEDFR